MQELILAGNAQTHPTASLVMGIVVVLAVLVGAVWLIGKITK